MKIKNFWSHLSIRIKLLSYFFVILLLVSLFNLYLNNNNYKVVDQFSVTMTNYYEINSLLVLSKENIYHLDNYLRALELSERDLYFETQSSMNGLIDDLIKMDNSLETQFALKAIRNSFQVTSELWAEAISQRENDVEGYFTKFYEGKDIQSYTQGYIEDLLYIRLGEGNELYSKILDEAEVKREISILLILGVFVGSLILGGLFAGSIVRPIKRLAKSSIAISSGNLEVDAVTINSQDEIGVLADSFNIMSASIRKYVSDLEQKVLIEQKLHAEELHVMKMEQLLKDSQFQALQSQINPHFLFNTLNVISRTAMFENADDTVKLLQAMSDIFRYKLRNDSAMIYISSELEIIEKYIYLQQFRFKERLGYECVVEASCESIEIPIFTLQPLVENAIIHGIEPKIEGGKIRIRIFKSNFRGKSLVHIRITDTGIGMSQERLAKVRHLDEINNRRIGVKNVYKRYKLTFQDKGNFKILSKEGMGTMVELRFITDIL